MPVCVMQQHWSCAIPNRRQTLMADEQPEAPAPEAPAAPQPPKEKRKKIPKEKDEIRLCAHSKFLYTWPLILVGFSVPLLNRIVGVNCGTWTWIITAIIVGTC